LAKFIAGFIIHEVSGDVRYRFRIARLLVYSHSVVRPTSKQVHSRSLAMMLFDSQQAIS